MTENEQQINSFIIPHELTDLNNFIYQQRTNKYKGNKSKMDNTGLCEIYISRAIRSGLKVEDYPIEITFSWYAKNRRKDPDNIAFAKKYILDAMQKAGLIENDGFNQISGFRDVFYLDKVNPRVEVKIESKREYGSVESIKLPESQKG